jgi:hypothetical protein
MTAIGPGGPLGECGLMFLIGINGVRDKDAGADEAHQYCCNVNHSTVLGPSPH